MRGSFFRIFLLPGVLSSCQPKNQQTTASDNASSSATLLSMTAPPQVNYSVRGLQPDTTLFTQPRRIGVLDDPSLVESSGIASSRRNPGYLWTEEDSGNPNQIQLIRQNGNVVARFTIDEVENQDWEDIAVGPGPVPGETYIYLAEIGDNRLKYPEKIIYRFPEPTISGKQLPFEAHITRAAAIRLRLPDGPQNAEAILIDPITKDLFMLSKGDQMNVYRAAFPQSQTRVITMTSELIIPFEKVTSAAVSPDGSEILIRTYRQLYYYKRQVGETVIDALKRKPLRLPLADEAQGEAVGWAIDSSGYYTASERVGFSAEPIYWYFRKK